MYFSVYIFSNFSSVLRSIFVTHEGSLLPSDPSSRLPGPGLHVSDPWSQVALSFYPQSVFNPLLII